MRIFLLDKNLVDPISHEKWEILTTMNGVVLKAITPDRWEENYRMLRLPENAHPCFPITTKKVVWPRYYNRAFYVDFFGLVRTVRAFRPDILFCFEEPFSAFAAQTHLLHAIACPGAKLAFYAWDNLSQGTHYTGRWIYPSLYKRIAGRSLKKADLIACATAEGESFLRPLARGDVRKIYFGVPLPKLDDTEDLSRRDDAEFVVGYLGRLLEMKGLDDFIDAIAMTPEGIRAVMIGAGPYRDALERRCVMRNVGRRVSILPAVSSDQAWRALRKMDVLVLPSRTTPLWKEQYGRVLVEAMTCGVPVVGSSSGAIPDVIGDAGLVFTEGDPADLAACLMRLHGDPVLKGQLAAAGKSRSSLFSTRRFAEEIYDACCNLMADRSSQSRAERR